MESNIDQLFSKYYTSYFNKLKLYAYSVLHDWNRAEEVTQDAFHIAWRKKEDFINSQNPPGWIMNTLKYTIKNVQRSDALRANLFVSLQELGEISSANLSVEEAEIHSLFNSVLSKDDYYLFIRVTLDKATYKEVSAELNITVWACQKRMQRILKKLRKYFSRE